MLNAHEANRLANERVEAQVKELLDELDAIVRHRCEEGAKNATWDCSSVSGRNRWSVKNELVDLGYDVEVEVGAMFIRW